MLPDVRHIHILQRSPFSLAARRFPRRLLTGAISWVAAVGMSGSAALPFVSGLLAARFGVVAIQPLCVRVAVHG
jgi:hypothetical protein